MKLLLRACDALRRRDGVILQTIAGGMLHCLLVEAIQSLELSGDDIFIPRPFYIYCTLSIYSTALVFLIPLLSSQLLVRFLEGLS